MEKNAQATTDSSSIREVKQDDVDKAYEFAKQHEVTLTPDDNKRILRKIDRNLLPLMIITYTLNFMVWFPPCTQEPSGILKWIHSRNSRGKVLTRVFPYRTRMLYPTVPTSVLPRTTYVEQVIVHSGADLIPSSILSETSTVGPPAPFSTLRIWCPSPLLLVSSYASLLAAS